MNVFISQSRKNKTQEEILAEREKAVKELNEWFGEVFILNSIQRHSEEVPPLLALAYSMECLAQADLAYFAEGWQYDRRCRIEHQSAVAYGVEQIDKLYVQKSLEDIDPITYIPQEACKRGRGVDWRELWKIK